MRNGLTYFNGINGATGEYALPPMGDTEIARLILSEPPAQNLGELKKRYEAKAISHWGVKAGVDPANLTEAGWGVIFGQADPDAPAKRDALAELLALRRQQAGDRYREYFGENGWRPGEESRSFLARLGKGLGPADPDKVPYYLMIVADPDEIPFRFQYQLDVQYAVGRLHLHRTTDYATYSHSVVLAESGALALAKCATFFAVRNADDPATAQSSDLLAQPLAESIRKARGAGWQVELIADADAKRDRLGSVISGDHAPALLFTASHGMCFPRGDVRQVAHQGALLCADWPGPREWRGAIPAEQYFAADNVGDDAHLLGRIFFHFGCYTAGTPRLDDFNRGSDGAPAALAGVNFVAGLAQRVLSHPGGGALAVIGHVDRAWGSAFLEQNAGPQLTTFESAVTSLLDGQRAGVCTEYFNERYAELSTVLTEELDQAASGLSTSSREMAQMWTENRDARNYVILGDPAVRLPVGSTT